MTREIKFRAWDTTCGKNNPKMHYFDLFEQTPYFGDSKEDFIVMQFTGLQDKNGKEIYDGDIVKCDEVEHFDMETRVLQSFNNALVTFYYGSFMYNPRCNKNQPHQLLSLARNIEIIGNIYENPELIK